MVVTTQSCYDENTVLSIAVLHVAHLSKGDCPLLNKLFLEAVEACIKQIKNTDCHL